jgi:hypothetical protein
MKNLPILILTLLVLSFLAVGCTGAYYGGGNIPPSLEPSYSNSGPPEDGWYGENPGRVIVQAVVGETNELIRYSAGRGRYELERGIFGDSRRDKARESYYRNGDGYNSRHHRRNSGGGAYCTSDDRRPACRW